MARACEPNNVSGNSSLCSLRPRVPARLRHTRQRSPCCSRLQSPSTISSYFGTLCSNRLYRKLWEAQRLRIEDTEAMKIALYFMDARVEFQRSDHKVCSMGSVGTALGQTALRSHIVVQGPQRFLMQSSQVLQKGVHPMHIFSATIPATSHPPIRVTGLLD